MHWQWLLWTALFAIGVLNGLLMSGVFDSRSVDSAPPPLPSSSHAIAERIPPASLTSAAVAPPSEEYPGPPLDLYAGDPYDGLGEAARGNISDWCYALRPYTDPIGVFLVPDTPGACQRYLAAPLGGGTLGDRVLAWTTGALVSVVWQMPFAVLGTKPLEACGTEKPAGAVCSPGAEAALGLNRGLPRVAALVQQRGLRVVDAVAKGVSLEELIAEAPPATPESCGTIYRLRTPLPLLQDLSAARWALTTRLGVAFRRAQQLGQAKTLFRTDAVAVAVHIARLPALALATGMRVASMGWMQQLLWQLVVLCDGGNFRSAPEPWDGTKATVFSGNSYAPVHVYMFAQTAEDAGWVKAMLPQDSTVVTMESEADVLRHLATADMLLCGNSTLCRAASLHTTRSLALVPTNREPRKFNPCPGDVQCIPDPVEFTQEQRLRILDVLDRWLIRKSASCPPQWLYPY